MVSRLNLRLQGHAHSLSDVLCHLVDIIHVRSSVSVDTASILREDAFSEALCYLRSMVRVPLILLMIAHQVNINLIVWQLT